MPRKPLVLVTVCLSVLAINLDTTIVNVALPSLGRELDADTRAVAVSPPASRFPLE